MGDVLSGVTKNGMGCFVTGCFVLHSKLSPYGPKFRPKWDQGRNGSLPKKIYIFFSFFFRETLFHSVTTQMQWQ